MHSEHRAGRQHGPSDGWQQQRDENGDDGNDNQQLDECEPTTQFHCDFLSTNEIKYRTPIFDNWGVLRVSDIDG